MSNAIDFLERMGQDARLRHATNHAIAQAMEIAQVHQTLQSAIMAGDGKRVEQFLGAKPNLCAVVFPADGHAE